MLQAATYSTTAAGRANENVRVNFTYFRSAVAETKLPPGSSGFWSSYEWMYNITPPLNDGNINYTAPYEQTSYGSQSVAAPERQRYAQIGVLCDRA